MRHAILCALIILSGGAAVAGEAAGGPPAEPSVGVRAPVQACAPDAPHAKFLAALSARAGALDPNDELRAELETAATVIDAYTIDRASLCRELEAFHVELAAARQRASEWKGLYEGELETEALLREKWQAALRKAAAPSAGGRRLIGCGPGGGLVYEPDGVVATRPFAGCILVLWP